ncbi:MAG TPA: hypothetical protein VNX68_07710 [Nitrosopumilaceae archaeon]|nr:hypothetical protein [Nitrosopumilaceae archaeon]
MISVGKPKYIFILIIAMFSCNSENKNMEGNIHIIIDYTGDGFNPAASFDLLDESYTIYYISKPALVIKVNLSNAERNLIVKLYYSYRLDEIKGKREFNDRCPSSPKNLTIIRVAQKNQEIKIDASCNEFIFWDEAEANRVKKFLVLVDEILKIKPEILKARQSDIFYI